MDKIKIGIPRSLYYYYFKDLWLNFFKNLDIDIIVSPKTNKEILDLGKEYANDEMCISLKNYLGHVAYLQNKCDYILVPRVDNYGIDNQMCTNFQAIYDIVSNLFENKILHYNIDLKQKETEEKAFINMGLILGRTKKQCTVAYEVAKEIEYENKEKLINDNIEALKSKKLKIMLISHPYNTYDEYIGKPIIEILEKYDVELIYAERFNNYKTNKLSKLISSTSYFKYSKELIGAIPMIEGLIDGVIFITSFPCALDSIANVLAMKKLKIPSIQLIVDDETSLVGFETRIESFIDILERNKTYENSNFS